MSSSHFFIRFLHQAMLVNMIIFLSLTSQAFTNPLYKVARPLNLFKGPASEFVVGVPIDNLLFQAEEVSRRFLKYKYIEDIEKDQLYNFYQARDKCSELNSTLWEILDGEEEWEAVIGMARDKDLTGMWLNARVTGWCPEDRSTCLETEAEAGFGVSVRWPSSRYSKYSRLIASPGDADDRNCVHVDTLADELLWRTHSCLKNGFWGLCVKRYCFPE